MSQYVFVDEAPRVYHDLGLVQPGDVRELDKPPDDRWKPAPKSPKPVKE